MSEDIAADESLPADASLAGLHLDSNQDTPRSDNNGSAVCKTDKLKSKCCMYFGLIGSFINHLTIPVDILLKATGNAPIMKKKKWAVDAEKPIGWIMEFVKKYLKLNDDEKLVSF